MRVLVTGGAGLLGTELIKKLVIRGHYVRAFDLPNVDFWRVEELKEVEVFRGDITALDNVRKAIEDVEAIFHLAAVLPPASEKNRELSENEVNAVLEKYNIDTSIPIIAQIGRFDPWKGIDRTIDAYRYVRKNIKCQLILAGGAASDDPEGERILDSIYEETKNDEDIHILNLSLEDRLENYMEVNALQRAADVIMQPSTKEGFALVITEALWKRKPVIAADVGAISLQIRDGVTGFFYQTPYKTAQKIVYLLEHPRVAQRIGEDGRKHVQEHFLLPDRIADYLMAMNMIIYGNLDMNIRDECVVSFRPWFRKYSNHIKQRSTPGNGISATYC